MDPGFFTLFETLGVVSLPDSLPDVDLITFPHTSGFCSILKVKFWEELQKSD